MIKNLEGNLKFRITKLVYSFGESTSNLFLKRGDTSKEQQT